MFSGCTKYGNRIQNIWAVSFSMLCSLLHQRTSRDACTRDIHKCRDRDQTFVFNSVLLQHWFFCIAFVMSVTLVDTVRGIDPVSEDDIAGEAVVGYRDRECSSETSKVFDSYADLKKYDGTTDDTTLIVWYFASFHTVQNPETCYQLRSQNMETIAVVGERQEDVEDLPSEFVTWHVDMSRSIQRARLEAFQRELEDLNSC